MEIFLSTFKRNPLHYIVVIFGCAVSALLATFFLFFSLKYLRRTVEFKRRTSFSKIEVILMIVSASIFAVGITIFSCFLAETLDRNTLEQVAPGHWIFWKSGIKPQMKEERLQESIKDYKALITLPEGMRFIDNPRYPLVFSDVLEPKASGPVSLLPNVVFVVVESFTPSPRFLNKQLLTLPEGQMIFDGAPYSADQL